MSVYGVTVEIGVEAESAEDAQRIVNEELDSGLKGAAITQVRVSEARSACYCGAIGSYHATGCEA